MANANQLELKKQIQSDELDRYLDSEISDRIVSQRQFNKETIKSSENEYMKTIRSNQSEVPEI